jgi:hypothetical protein
MNKLINNIAIGIIARTGAFILVVMYLTYLWSVYGIK